MDGRLSLGCVKAHRLIERHSSRRFNLSAMVRLILKEPNFQLFLIHFIFFFFLYLVFLFITIIFPDNVDFTNLTLVWN